MLHNQIRSPKKVRTEKYPSIEPSESIILFNLENNSDPDYIQVNDSVYLTNHLELSDLICRLALTKGHLLAPNTLITKF